MSNTRAAHPLQAYKEMKQIIDYFEGAYIINLEDRPDRREEVMREFRRIGIEVPNQKIRFYNAKRPTDKGSFANVGVRGCFNSHRNVLELASREKLKNVLVFEDDVSFRDVAPSIIGQIAIALARETWDILYFGYLQPSDTGLAGPLADFRDGVMGAHFYAVSGGFMGPLLGFMKSCEVRPPGHPDGGPMPADAALNHIRFLIQDMRVLLAVPNLAYQRSSRTDVSPPRVFDRIRSLDVLIRAARGVKHRLRMAVDAKKLRQRCSISGTP